HYPKGFMGFDEPGDHTELVRIGVRRLLAQIKKEQPEGAPVVRPWIQGMPYHAPTFGPKYIADEIGHADKGGASGWMPWNPSQDFTKTWEAIAPKKAEEQKSAATSRDPSAL